MGSTVDVGAELSAGCRVPVDVVAGPVVVVLSVGD